MNEKETLVLRVTGSEEDIETLFSKLEKHYYLIHPSKPILNSDDGKTHRFVDLLPREPE